MCVPAHPRPLPLLRALHQTPPHLPSISSLPASSCRLLLRPCPLHLFRFPHLHCTNIVMRRMGTHLGVVARREQHQLLRLRVKQHPQHDALVPPERVRAVPLHPRAARRVSTSTSPHLSLTLSPPLSHATNLRHADTPRREPSVVGVVITCCERRLHSCSHTANEGDRPRERL
jgi:hypothetical protein